MLKTIVIGISLTFTLVAQLRPYAERLNNKTAYAIPPAPALGPAGYVFKDPTFGTTIMRLTDDIDYPFTGMRHVYGAMVSPFNVNSTWLFCGPMNDAGHFIEFDPVNFKRGTRSIDIQAQTKMPTGLRPNDGIWSKVDPHIYFAGASDSKIYQFDVTKPALGWMLFKDLTQLLTDAGMPLGSTFIRISSSWHDDRFALHNDHSGVIWSRSLDKLVWVPPPERRAASNKGFMDKSGQFYAEAYEGAPSVGGFWKIDTKEQWPWPNAGHGDMGSGTLVALDNSVGSRIALWELSPDATDRPKEIVFDWSDMPPPIEWGGHSSMQSDLEDFTAWEFYQGASTMTRIYNDEIGLASTDGSKDVYRLVQHQSHFIETQPNDYWSQPRVALSPDGKFAAFDSNWGLRLGPDGKTPFTDVFIIDLRDIPRRTPYRPATPPAIIPCTITLAPSLIAAPAMGGQFQVTVTTAQGCSWNASSNADWISALSAGTGTATFSIGVSPATGVSRQGSVTVGDQVIAISQPQSPCVYAVSPQQLTASASAGTSFIQVSAAPACAWNATSQSLWIGTTALTASGPGVAVLTISDNPTASSRIGVVSVADSVVSVQQLGTLELATCHYTLSPANGLLPADPGMGSIQITGICPALHSAAPWLTPGVFYFWQDNPGPARTATLSFGGQEFTVTQAGR